MVFLNSRSIDFNAEFMIGILNDYNIERIVVSDEFVVMQYLEFLVDSNSTCVCVCVCVCVIYI